MFHSHTDHIDTLHHPMIPEQIFGSHKDIHYAVDAHDLDDATLWFLDIKDNLLAVNEWNKNIEGAARFALADKHKKPLNRKAHSHDQVLIYPDKYPVGDTGNYAFIELIEYDYDPDTDYESIGMRLHLPSQTEEGIAFNTSLPTTMTLICDRKNTGLSASCYIRNLRDGAANAWLNINDEAWLAMLNNLI